MWKYKSVKILHSILLSYFHPLEQAVPGQSLLSPARLPGHSGGLWGEWSWPKRWGVLQKWWINSGIRSLDDEDDLWRGWWFGKERSWQSELCILIDLYKRRWLVSWLIHVFFYFVEERRFLEKLPPSLDWLVLRPGGAGGVLPGHRGGHVEGQQAQDAVLSAKMK